MKRSDAPKKHSVPFGVNGPRENLPDDTPAGDNTASYQKGFPPVTMILKAAGGLPPKGQDMNQILYELSSLARWNSAGALNSFDAAFADATGGYPSGALLLSADGTKIWWNTRDANQTDPDGDKASGWKNLLSDQAGLFLQKAQNLADVPDKEEARKNLELDKVGNFTAVQQGGGIGQNTNKIYLGLKNNGKLGVTVDNTDKGELFTTENPPTAAQTESFPAEGGTVGEKGVETPGLFVNGNLGATGQGLHVIWNETTKRGETAFVCNAGSGTGGFVLRTVNNENTKEYGRVDITGTGSLNTGNTLNEMGRRVYSPNNPPTSANPGAGWWRDNVTELIIQMGSGSNSSSNVEVHNFNIAFPNRCMAIVGTLGTAINLGSVVYLQPLNNSQFTTKTTGNSIVYTWIAIGY